MQAGWLVLRHPGLLTLLLAVLAAGNAAIQPRGLAPDASQEWHVWLGNERAGGAAVEFVLAHPGRTRRYRGAGDVGTVGFHAAVRSGADEANFGIDGLAGTTMYQFDGDLAKTPAFSDTTSLPSPI